MTMMGPKKSDPTTHQVQAWILIPLNLKTYTRLDPTFNDEMQVNSLVHDKDGCDHHGRRELVHEDIIAVGSGCRRIVGIVDEEENDRRLLALFISSFLF